MTCHAASTIGCKVIGIDINEKELNDAREESKRMEVEALSTYINTNILEFAATLPEELEDYKMVVIYIYLIPTQGEKTHT